MDFNGKKYHYENLENEMTDDYYVIKRNPMENQIDNHLMKRVYIPKEYEAMLD